MRRSTARELLRILTKLTDAEIFEQFIHKNYVGAKRFSLEGAESMIPMIDLLIEAAGAHGIEELVIGMAHRGRLNVLVNVMGKNVREIFAAFDDKRPERFLGAGDVKYHLGYSSDVRHAGRRRACTCRWRSTRATSSSSNPVVEGRVRAKIDRRKRKSTMPLLVHGDASFMGQGVVAETLNLAQLEGYTTGGTIHLVVNNQIGFTTLPSDSRSTRYCTDIARMLRVPVFHVNGEDPEAVIQVTRLAVEYRQRFKQDVVIDMYCYRKYGHNEGDEPRFTQPLMYSLIDKKPARARRLRRSASSRRATSRAKRPTPSRRSAAPRSRRRSRRPARATTTTMPEAMGGVWGPYRGGPDAGAPEVPTGVPEGAPARDARPARHRSRRASRPNPKALKIIEQRRERAHAGHGLDWGTAEHLAFASILLEGHGIRISGQDARRGTFSHRHAVLFDTETGRALHAARAPRRKPGRRAVGRFEVYDSPLSEAGRPRLRVRLLARIARTSSSCGRRSSATSRTPRRSSSTSSSSRPRTSGGASRASCCSCPTASRARARSTRARASSGSCSSSAEDNIQVCNLTTPAQFFHALRRQVNRPWRKPLVIFTPKSLLRHPPGGEHARRAGERLVPARHPRRHVDPATVKRILLCSGKVYFDLAAEARASGWRATTSPSSASSSTTR